MGALFAAHGSPWGPQDQIVF
uniref:Uncharacterized protein n=1 Tax=Anguilla anguilla TaxID=7936 RepID=A0A0E9TF25_ANGAN